MGIKEKIQMRLTQVRHTLHAVEKEYQEGISAKDVEDV